MYGLLDVRDATQDQADVAQADEALDGDVDVDMTQQLGGELVITGPEETPWLPSPKANPGDASGNFI